jgi:hypothetical protein
MPYEKQTRFFLATFATTIDEFTLIYIFIRVIRVQRLPHLDVVASPLHRAPAFLFYADFSSQIRAAR